MKQKEYKIRNRDDAKVICARFTSRIEVMIQDKWFVAVRIRPGHKKNPHGYRVEFYKFPNLMGHQTVRVNTMEEARAEIKRATNITMPKVAFDKLDASKLADTMRGKKWRNEEGN